MKTQITWLNKLQKMYNENTNTEGMLVVLFNDGDIRIQHNSISLEDADSTCMLDSAIIWWYEALKSDIEITAREENEFKDVLRSWNEEIEDDELYEFSQR